MMAQGDPSPRKPGSSAKIPFDDPPEEERKRLMHSQEMSKQQQELMKLQELIKEHQEKIRKLEQENEKLKERRRLMHDFDENDKGKPCKK